MDIVRAANSRNRARNSSHTFTLEDLKVLWVECGGRCSVSQLPFSLVVVGDGQAKRPFAPSLDRKDRHQPYTRNNVRLVTSVANFAMNAWGLDPVLVLAAAIYKAHGDRTPLYDAGPGDAEVNDEAVTGGDDVITGNGTLIFPSRGDIVEAIIGLLQTAALSSREIEDLLAEKFGLTTQARQAKHPKGMPIWRNLLAFGLKDLVRAHRIQRVSERRVPGGGTTGIYQLQE